MPTTVEPLPFDDLIQSRGDATARRLRQAWSRSAKLSEGLLKDASKIVVVDKVFSPHDTPHLLFVGAGTLAKFVSTRLRAGPSVPQFPKEYVEALGRGYFASAQERRPVAEVISTDAFQNLEYARPLSYVRIILPAELKDGRPVFAVYSQDMDGGSVQDLLHRYTGPGPHPECNVPALTRRELDCVRWAAEGKTEWETAGILGVAPATVASHLGSARRKLNANNKVHLVTKALRLGVIA